MRQTVIRTQRSALAAALKISVSTCDLKNEGGMDHVLIRPASGQVRLCSTNLQLSSDVVVGAVTAGEAPFCLPARDLARAVDVFPAGEITIVADIGGSPEVVARVHPTGAKRDCFTFQGRGAGDFPSLPALPTEWNAVGVAALRQLLEVCRPASAKDPTRLHLSSVRIEPDAERGVLVGIATDGHRMHVAQVEAPCDGWPADGLTIPARSVDALLAFLGKEAEMRVGGRGSERWLHVRSGSATMGMQAIGAAFPPWRQVMPAAKPEGAVEVDVSALSSAVARASILAKEATGASFELGADGLLITTRDDQGREMVAEVEATGKPFSLRLNPAYARAALDAMDTDTCKLQVSAPLDPVLMTSTSGAVSVVLMPMRV